jgi:hypothetical protein
MALYNRLEGGFLALPTAAERHRARLARMRRVVWLAVNSMRDERDATGGQLVMYTLTYRRVDQWEPRHICNAVRWLRSQQVRAYVWVAELQGRGAVHYHVLALLPAGHRWVKPTESAGGWAQGFTWVTPAVQKPFYIMKYLQKGSDHATNHEFPRGLRLYGVSQWTVRRLSFEDAVRYRECQVPRWIGLGACDPRLALSACRVVGGVRVGGYLYPSPYTVAPLPDIDEVSRSMYNRAWGKSPLVGQ